MTPIEVHHDRVRHLRCLITGRPNPTLHHCKGGSMIEIIGLHGASQKVSDWLVIPLDWLLHLGKLGIDGGVGVETWERNYGSQVYHLDHVSYRLGYNVWKRAGVDRAVYAAKFYETSKQTIVTEVQ